MNKRYWCRSTTGKKSIWDCEANTQQGVWNLLVEENVYPTVLLTLVDTTLVEYGYKRTNFIYRPQKA
jgi:hypothetical protein